MYLPHPRPLPPNYDRASAIGRHGIRVEEDLGGAVLAVLLVVGVWLLPDRGTLPMLGLFFSSAIVAVAVSTTGFGAARWLFNSASARPSTSSALLSSLSPVSLIASRVRYCAAFDRSWL
mgnify:CR=1 FL=1